MVSEIWSATLSGWPSETDSDENKYAIILLFFRFGLQSYLFFSETPACFQHIFRFLGKKQKKECCRGTFTCSPAATNEQKTIYLLTIYEGSLLDDNHLAVLDIQALLGRVHADTIDVVNGSLGRRLCRKIHNTSSDILIT